MVHIPSGVEAGVLDRAPASCAAPILCLFAGSTGGSNPADRPRHRAGLMLVVAFTQRVQSACGAEARQHRTGLSHITEGRCGACRSMRQPEYRHLLTLKDSIGCGEDAHDPSDGGPAQIGRRGTRSRRSVGRRDHHTHRPGGLLRLVRNGRAAQIACAVMHRLARAERPLHQRTSPRFIRAQRPNVAAARSKTHHRRLTHLGHRVTHRRLHVAGRFARFVPRTTELCAISLHDQPPEVPRVGAPRSERCETQGAPPQRDPSDTSPAHVHPSLAIMMLRASIVELCQTR